MTETVKIERLTHEGRGVAYLNNKILLVDNALPGEVVKVEFIRSHRRFSETQSSEIIVASPERIASICPHYHNCGGCSLQHVSSEKQLAIKTNALQNHLDNFGHLTQIPDLSPPLLGPTQNYRRKARLAVKYVIKKKKLMVGFHEKHNSLVTDVTVCPILEKILGDRLADLAEKIAKLTIFDAIPQVEFAKGEETGALIFRNLVECPKEDLEELRQFCEQLNLQGYLQPGNTESITPFTEVSPLFYKYQDLQFIFNPNNFIQINAAINLQLINQVITWLELEKSDRILDLFCGIGNFSLPIAKKVETVWGIEGDKMAIELATQNAKINQIDNIKFSEMDLAKVDLTTFESWLPNKIVLDPPRSGAFELCKQSFPKQIKRIVYVSCDSATFARDARLLSQQGFNLTEIKLANMYPHTKHVEVISLFQR